MKIASGRGRKNHCQGMGRVWEEKLLLLYFFAKIGKKQKKDIFHFHSKIL